MSESQECRTVEQPTMDGYEIDDVEGSWCLSERCPDVLEHWLEDVSLERIIEVAYGGLTWKMEVTHVGAHQLDAGTVPQVFRSLQVARRDLQ